MKPDLHQLVRATRLVGVVLGHRSAIYCPGARLAFALGGDWRLVVSPDDAGRFRVDACLGGRVRATMWCLADDHRRLAELVASMRNEASALVA